MSQTVKKAVIPVAGLGTRFLPQTKAFPKELLPLVDRPVIQYIVQEAVDSGIEEIVFVVSDDKKAIEKHFAQDAELEKVLEEKGKQKELQSIASLHTMATFHFCEQNEPLGLGHAVMQAQKFVEGEPFVIFGGDDVVESNVPAAKQLIEVYEQYEAPVLGVISVPQEDVVRYGIIDPAEGHGDSVWNVQAIIEKPQPEEAPSTLAVGGRWLVTPDIFEYLERVQPDQGGEIQITEALKMLAAEKQLLAKQYEGIYRDCGNKTEYVKAMIAFAVKHPEIGKEISSFIRTLGV